MVEDCLERYYEEQMKSNGYREEVVLEPIVDFKEAELEPKESSQSDSGDKEWEGGKSDTITLPHYPSSASLVNESPSPPSPTARTVTKIHYLTPSDQLQFLEWMKRRSDIKKCCLRNGSFQMEDC